MTTDLPGIVEAMALDDDTSDDDTPVESGLPSAEVRLAAAQIVRHPWRCAAMLDHINTVGRFAETDLNDALVWLGYIAPHPSIQGRFHLTKPGTAFRSAWASPIRLATGAWIRPTGPERYDIVRYDAPIGEVWLDPDADGWLATVGFPTGDQIGPFRHPLDAAEAVFEHRYPQRQTA